MDIEKAISKKSNRIKKFKQDVSEGTVSTKAGSADDAALDPTLPLNWSGQEKFFNMAVPSILCFVVWYQYPWLTH
jgi:hypothetical protein